MIQLREANEQLQAARDAAVEALYVDRCSADLALAPAADK